MNAEGNKGMVEEGVAGGTTPGSSAMRPGDLPEGNITSPESIKPPTENMEVHHHPELPHKGEKKNFKEYFLEFLMIFLAVSMGFIAENIRERLSDNEKEKYYIESLVQNLKDDTASIKLVIDANLAQINGIDSLRIVQKSKVMDTNVQDSLFYYTIRYLFYGNDFKSNDITLTQLRNAGGYRVIKNSRVLDSISVYEAALADMQSQYKFVENDLAKTQDDALEIFDMSLVSRFKKPGANIKVLTTVDTSKIINYYNKCWLTTVALQGYTNMLLNHQKYIASFIVFLKSQYSIE